MNVVKYEEAAAYWVIRFRG